jgi:alkylation response protein AidB-like acyl-CoA dehydrogenase
VRRTLYEDDHEAFRASFRTFLDVEVVPHLAEWEAAGITPQELFSTAGRSGFLGSGDDDHGAPRGRPLRRGRGEDVHQTASTWTW